MLVLSCNLREVRGLFCKSISARGISPSWAISTWAGVAWATRVGRAGEFVFLFLKELEIVLSRMRVGRVCDPREVSAAVPSSALVSLSRDAPRFSHGCTNVGGVLPEPRLSPPSTDDEDAPSDACRGLSAPYPPRFS